MKTIVKLRAQFTAPGGGTTYPGERIGVDAATAKHLIETGAAVLIPELVERATKPVTDTTALKGFAKLNWLRARIRECGAEPTGRTVAAMEDQLRSLS